MTTTSRPFASVKLVICGPIPACAEPASAAQVNAAIARVSLGDTNLLSWDEAVAPTMHVPGGERERKPRPDGRKCGWGALSRRSSASLALRLEPLLEGRSLTLILLNAHAVGVIG